VINKIVSGIVVLFLLNSCLNIPSWGTNGTKGAIGTHAPGAAAMGINIDAPLDYSENRTFADMIKTARSFMAGSNVNGSTYATVDANGWPTQDFSFYVYAGIKNMYGTYTLSFNGKATVTVSCAVSGNVSLSYDAASNTSTGTIVVTTAQDAGACMTLTFANTQATASSAINTGVTNVKLMRPNALGSSTSFPATTLFNTPLLALISNFSTIRFMDWHSTNWNQQVNWSDRPLPSWATFNICSGGTGVMPGNVACPAYGWQGIGAPIEYAVMLANTTNKDMWINIPAGANNAYVTNEANLIKYGSDGVNPYTSTQSNPVYPPLNANLNVYVEYSNEVWNSIFSQMQQNCQLASNELVAGQNSDGDPTTIDFDGSWESGSSATGTLSGGVVTFSSALILPTGQQIAGTGIPNGTTITTGSTTSSTAYPVNWTGTVANESIYFPQATYGNNTSWNWDMCFRRQAERTVQISNIFRSVFGDAAMITRIRPVMESQFGNPGADLYGEATMLLGYYDNLSPGNTPVATAHPPSYYIYGAGGSAYYNPPDPSPSGVNNDAAGLSTFFAGMYPATNGFANAINADAAVVSTMGVKRVAYEGGPSLDNLGGSTPTGQYLVFNELAALAVTDSRMTTTMVTAHNLWAANGGDLLNYFTATGNQQWGFTANIFNLNTPKLNAITALNQTAPAALTYGTTVPGNISAVTHCSNGCFGTPPISMNAWNTIASPSIISTYKAANNGSAGNYAYWWSYTFNSVATTTKTWMISLTFNSTTTATVNLYLDGTTIGSQVSTSGSAVTFTANGIAPGLHSIIATSGAGSYNLKNVEVVQN
jgi:hypothetical protein